MGSVTTALCNSFKHELLLGIHDFEGDAFKIALIKASPTDSYGANTHNYEVISYDNDGGTSFGASTALKPTSGGNNDEYSGTGYSAGGKPLSGGAVVVTNNTAHVDFSNVEWTSATIDADGALIYNSDNKDSKTGRAVCVIGFASTQSSDNGTFSISFPTAGESTSIIRIA